MKGTRIVVSRIVSLVIVAGLLAGMASGVLATAQSPPPDNQRHLLLVPSDAEGTAALARTDARVIAKYESFSLVEARGGDDERLRRAGAERRDDMRTVETAAGELDPRSDRSSLAAKEAPDRQETLALVQFVGPPKEAWLDRLRETGARIVTYQAENAYVVHARGAAVDRLAALQGTHPAVRAVSVLSAADKLEDRSSRSGVFAVTTVDGTPGEEARDEAAALGGPAAAAPITVGALRTEYRPLSSAEVAELARDPAVVAVEAHADPELFDERAAQIVAGNLNAAFAPTSPDYLDWLIDPERIPNDTTFDFAIDVTDVGFDNGADPPAHEDFYRLGSDADPDRLAYVADYTDDPDGRDCSGHGTHVASIATGYNTKSSAPEFEDASNFQHGLGVAPFAQVGASKIFRSCGGDSFSMNATFTDLTENAHADGARISNNSWGTGTVSAWGDYSARSREYDRLVRDARPDQPGSQPMVEVFAAGNDGDDNADNGDPPFPNEGYGTISAEGSAKNVITVGASESVRATGTPDCETPNSAADSARDILNFSSRGPTNDGRLKPDLVAPGTHITGAAPQHPGYTGHGVCHKFLSGSTSYSLLSGTSQATPHVSGAAAVIRSWFKRTEGVEPSPALTKALLINTATDLSGGNDGKGSTIAAGPNTDQGWGRVNLGNTIDSTAREYRDQAPADLLSSSGQFTQRAYSVPDPSRPIKVTLSWTDAPGPTSGNPVVNNLDLAVDAGGRTYKGNVFAGAFSRTGGTPDPRNNVESVYLPANTVTRLGVTVKGTTIAGDGVPGIGDSTDQDYALVVSNADALTSTPVLSGEAPEVSDAGPGGDDDGALEPGETFGLEQDIHNGGDGPATGIDGTMSGPAAVTFTEPASAYPDTDPGESSANVDQFEGTVAAGATCGAEVQATLSLDTDQGTQQIPVVLPTGYPGAATPQSSTNVPRSIPDDSSAGVTSTLNIANSGLIKDLDVSISRITHGWVGDLTIQLTGPDGTTVKLAEHPGGPDNGGNDFVDTVFDDEAAVNISSGNAPYTGSFRPQNDELSRFDGKNKQGTWTLRIRDLFEGDTGTLEGWGTSTRTATCARNPQTTITAGPPANQFVDDPNPSFQFTATEAPGDPPFECSLDGEPFTECESAGSQSYTGLSEGQHTFEVRAIDADGDADPSPASRTWAVDTVGPAVDIDHPLTAQLITDPTPTFTGSVGTAFGDLPTVTVEIRPAGSDPNSSPLQTPTATVNGSTWSATAAQLPDGEYRVDVRQSDQAGHETTASATFTLVGDFVSPVVSIHSPADGSTVTDTTPTIAGTAGTAVGDLPTVKVEIFNGPGATGALIHTNSNVAVHSGAWSTTAPQPLALASYSAKVTQGDTGGNQGTHIVNFTVVDGAAPAVTVTSPANGSTTSDTTPQLSGGAGTAPGDLPSVTVRVRNAGGALVQQLGASASGGAWSATAGPLAEGTYTVTAEQSDASGNVGTSAPSTFTVDAPDPPPPPVAPSFLLAPAEERIADVLAGRLTAVAACASACRVDARLTASSRTARTLGLGARSTVLGRGSKRLRASGTAAAAVRLNKRARAALRGRTTANVSLRVKVTDGIRVLALNRTVSLRRSAWLKRIASRGLGLWAVCSERCPLTGKLTLSPKAARRIGLRPRGAARMQVAAGRTTAPAGMPARLTLKVHRGAKKALSKARRVPVVLEAVAGTAPSPRRSVSRAITLRP